MHYIFSKTKFMKIFKFKNQVITFYKHFLKNERLFLFILSILFTNSNIFGQNSKTAKNLKPSSIQPVVGIPCYVNGDATGTSPAFAIVFYKPNQGIASLGGASDIYHNGTAAQIGSTWGVAYNGLKNSFYTSTVIRRHSGLTSNGTGAIFKIPANFDSNKNPVTAPSLLINLNGAAIGTGGTVNTGADPHTGGSLGGTGTANQDQGAFDAVGKVGLGDIDVSADLNTLYAMNLFSKELVEINIANESSPSVTTTYPINQATTGVGCTNGVLRPWAIEVANNGEVFVGAVCSAENNTGMPEAPFYDAAGTFPSISLTRIPEKIAAIDAEQAKLHGYVFKLDKTSGNYTQVLDFDLNANRSNTTLGTFADWLPWINDAQYPSGNGITQNSTTGVTASNFPNYKSYPQPMVADLDIMDNGELLVSLMDRWGLQTGTANKKPDGSFTENGRPAGQIIKFASTGTNVWSVKENKQARTQLSVPNAEYGDVSSSFEKAATLGGMAILPGQNSEFIAVTIDPIGASANGLSVLNIPNPSRIDTQILVSGGLVADKGQALGDVELGLLIIAPEIPLSIGSTVFYDPNNDGIQLGPLEVGLPNLVVKLYLASAPNNPILTTQTDAFGNYVFNNLEPGNYLVGVSAPTAYPKASTVTTPNSGINTDIDGRNVGSQASGPGTESKSIQINLQANAQPVSESGQGNTNLSSIDINGNATIDFGFNDGTLPIKLNYFNSKQLENNILLSWKTEAETNFSHFEVQKSKDAKEFGKIGIIKSSNSNFYNLKDSNPIIGNNYYRLKMIDLDGSSTFSKIISINFAKDNEYVIVQNPVKNGEIRILSNLNNLQFTLFGALGNKIEISKTANTNGYLLKTKKLVSNVYYLNIIDAKGNGFTKKILIP